MYDFIFYFFYKYFQRTNDSIPRYRAILAVATAVGFHLFCVISIIKYFTDLNISRFHPGYLQNKLFFTPFILALILVIYFRYNKSRTDLILRNKEKEGKAVFNVKNIILVFVIIVMPLIIGILFINVVLR